MKKIITGLALAAFCSTASATLYNIDAVLTGTDSNYGFSGLHDATGSNAMSGPGLAGFGATPVSGTYDDSDGSFNLVLTLIEQNSSGASGTLSLSGDLDFISGSLNPAGTLSAVFSNPVGLLQNANVQFAAGAVCCNGATQAPNSFGLLGGVPTMSLWGADFPVTTATVGPNFGLDLRVQMSPVPVPAAAWLFGTGLLGLVGVARRKTA